MSADIRFRLLAKVAQILCPDYPMKWPQLDWVHDPVYRAYLDRFGELTSHNIERRWMMQQLLRLVEGIKGDTAECGVFQGAGSYLICKSNAGRRKHHIFDSFEGISTPDAYDGEYWTQGAFATAESVVADRLKEFSGHFQLYKGWIPERFDIVKDCTFAFVHIDVDLHQPTRDSMAFFYPRMSPGGIIVCDDYGSSTCPGASQSIDEYLADKPEKMIEMSCGSGFMIKDVATSGANPTPRGLTEARPSAIAVLNGIAALTITAAASAVRKLTVGKPRRKAT